MQIATRLLFALTLLSLSCMSNPTAAQSSSERSAAELMDAVMWNREPIGGPFALIDQNGIRRSEVEFRGKVMRVDSGFTYCPDICPTDLDADDTRHRPAGAGRRASAADLHHGRP